MRNLKDISHWGADITFFKRVNDCILCDFSPIYTYKCYCHTDEKSVQYYSLTLYHTMKAMCTKLYTYLPWLLYNGYNEWASIGQPFINRWHNTKNFSWKIQTNHVNIHQKYLKITFKNKRVHRILQNHVGGRWGLTQSIKTKPEWYFPVTVC